LLLASKIESKKTFRFKELSMPESKANILVAFYSRDGSVEALAKAISEGAREAGAEVRLRRVPDIVSTAVMAKVPGWEERSKKMLAEYGAPTLADVEWADGIIFGTPTRFGNTSAELKAFIDSLGGLWIQGKLNGKAAGAFTSTAGPHGGNETTLISLYLPMAHLGFIIVPTGYTHEKIFQGHGTPYGSSSISGQNGAPPTADELIVAKHQGARMTQVAAALKAAR
jgi:NAD(P)H dehydrogenase (quinone)